MPKNKPSTHPAKKLKKSHKLRKGGNCEGDCSGTGEASEKTPGACPSDCSNHVYKQQTINEAKKVARLNAITDCQVLENGGPNCLCRDGTYTQESSKCETVEVTVGEETFKQCKWTVKYKYTGTCKETK